MSADIWQLIEGDGPLIATAIHNGHDLRPDISALMSLSDADRLREEDPYTGNWTVVGDTQIIANRSRFEVDLNRPKNQAVYVKPEDAWGLNIWRKALPPDVIARSLDEYDSYYEELTRVLDNAAERHGFFVVLDIHSYNHRRPGPDKPPEDQEKNPEVNVGTGNMDRSFWAPVVDSFMNDMRHFSFLERNLDVRENIKFQGGWMSRWIHDNYPKKGCALAIEFKKFFMDEWTGEANRITLDAITRALESTLPGMLKALNSLKI